MPTQLTAPVIQQATHATLDGIEVALARNSDLTVNAADSQISVVFVLRRADGSLLERRQFTRAMNQVPVAVRTALVSLQNALLTAARAGGVLPAGTDTADF